MQDKIDQLEQEIRENKNMHLPNGTNYLSGRLQRLKKLKKEKTMAENKPQDTTAIKEPPKPAEATCELCKKKFAPWNGEHLCWKCRQKKRDTKKVMLFIVTIFSAIQGTLLNLVNYYVDAATMVGPVKDFLTVLFAAVVIGGIAELKSEWSNANKDLKDENLVLRTDVEKSAMREEWANCRADDSTLRLSSRELSTTPSTPPK